MRLLALWLVAGCAAPPCGPWYTDADGDGWGGSQAIESCAPEPGWALVGGDCDDSDPEVHLADRRLEGNVVIRDASDLAAFRARCASEIGGNLKVAGTALRALPELASVTAVDGNVVITDNWLLTRLDDLRSLERVGGDVRLETNGVIGDTLTSIGLDGLAHVAGDVTILDHPHIHDAAGLSSLQTVGGTLRLDPLIALDGLERLQSVGGDLRARATVPIALASLERVDGVLSLQGPLPNLSGLSALTDVGHLEVTSLPGLTSMDGLHELVRAGDVTITGNPSLASLRGLSSLRVIDGSLVLQRNPSLESAHGLDGLREVHGNVIVDVPSLAGLDSLTRIGGDLSAQAESPAGMLALEAVDGVFEVDGPFRDFEGFEALRSVGSLDILYRDTLTSLRGLESLASAGVVRINGNDALQTLAGLDGLRTCDGMVRIHANPALLDLEGLGSLATAGSLSLSDNDRLVDFTGLDSLTTLTGSLAVERHDTLVRLHGLEGLREAQQVRIAFNPKLADLSALHGLTPPVELSIRSNASVTTEEIAALEEAIGNP